jgi:DNA-binding PadR family transcriptional regulator
MTPDQSHRSLSELELAALGYLWRDGPCTAYRVRRGFEESPSSHWSGSSGAIYPLLRRLEERGFVRSKSGATGARPRKTVSVTPDGRDVLRKWLESVIDLDVASSIHDALRTRMFFLDLLPPAARLDVVRSAIRACEEHTVAIEQDLEDRETSGDRFGVLAARGAWHAARARLVWLGEIEADPAAEVD